MSSPQAHVPGVDPQLGKTDFGSNPQIRSWEIEQPSPYPLASDYAAANAVVAIQSSGHPGEVTLGQGMTDLGGRKPSALQPLETNSLNQETEPAPEHAQHGQIPPGEMTKREVRANQYRLGLETPDEDSLDEFLRFDPR
jgi:hypothetical protein